MGEAKDDDRDEEWFKEVYGKEYTGPVRPGSDNARDSTGFKKRSHIEGSTGGPDNEDEGPPDPNAVPTDFTSREAKVWEAKSKAIERNWKKKKEEELICRICGEYGHFSQGCPTTLGVNRKQSELVEKIPVKDRRLKPKIIGTAGATIQGIEKDTGCRLKLEDNLAAGNGSFFVRITGSNRAMIGKAVAAVKKLLDNAGHDRRTQNSYKSQESHSRGAHAHMMGMQHLAGQQAHPHDPSLVPYPGQDVPYYGDGPHGNMGQLEARHQWEPENQNGSFPYGYKGDRLNQKGSVNAKGDYGVEHESAYDERCIGQMLEELEHKFVQETMQVTKELNDAEDEENARHRESIRDIQEQHQQKMATLRAQQGKRREEFLRQEAQFRQQHYQQYQQPAQAGAKHYSYDMGGPMSGGFTSSVREQPGYGIGSADRNDMPGGRYSSYRSDDGYHNSSHSYGNAGYESGMHHSRNQGYDAAPYRY